MRVCPTCSRRYLQDEPYCSLDGARTQPLEKIDEADDAAMIGATLGQYSIVRLVGRGGMGRVFEAEHVVIGRRVALKLLNAEFCTNREIVNRFFNEARAVNQIRHENIVEVTDFGTTADGGSFIVMELLDGTSLKQVLRREGRLSPVRAAHVGAQIASALAGAHGAGVVHRDLKPHNVMLVQRRRDADFVKLFDFGVAKLLDGQASGVETKAGAVIGTPRYMSPEQAESSSVDWRSDLYSLGVMLYQMVTGEVPFDGSMREVLRKHLLEPPRRPSQLMPELSPAFERVILQCLEKERDRRPETAALLEAELLKLAGERAAGAVLPENVPIIATAPAASEVDEAQPTTLGSSAGQRAGATFLGRLGGWKLWAFAAVGGVVLAVGALAVTGAFGGSEPDTRPAARAADDDGSTTGADPADEGRTEDDTEEKALRDRPTGDGARAGTTHSADASESAPATGPETASTVVGPTPAPKTAKTKPRPPAPGTAAPRAHTKPGTTKPGPTKKVFTLD